MLKKSQYSCQEMLSYKICVLTASLCCYQACSQACLSGLATVNWRNHVVQNVRAYFMLYDITIKFINAGKD